MRARIKRMEEEKLIRLTAVTNIDRFGDALLAYIWVEVERSDQHPGVAQCTGGYPGAGLCRGHAGALRYSGDHHGAQYGAPGGVCAHTHQCIDGVRRTESTLGVNFVKHDYRMARIVS